MLGRIVTLHAVGVAFFEIAGPDTRNIDQTLRSVLACALEQVVISNFPNQKSVAMLSSTTDRSLLSSSNRSSTVSFDFD